MSIFGFGIGPAWVVAYKIMFNMPGECRPPQTPDPITDTCIVQGEKKVVRFFDDTKAVQGFVDELKKSNNTAYHIEEVVVYLNAPDKIKWQDEPKKVEEKKK